MRLQEEIYSLPSQDMVFVVEHFDAKVGRDTRTAGVAG